MPPGSVYDFTTRSSEKSGTILSSQPPPRLGCIEKKGARRLEANNTALATANAHAAGKRSRDRLVTPASLRCGFDLVLDAPRSPEFRLAKNDLDVLQFVRLELAFGRLFPRLVVLVYTRGGHDNAFCARVLD